MKTCAKKINNDWKWKFQRKYTWDTLFMANFVQQSARLECALCVHIDLQVYHFNCEHCAIQWLRCVWRCEARRDSNELLNSSSSSDTGGTSTERFAHAIIIRWQFCIISKTKESLRWLRFNVCTIKWFCAKTKRNQGLSYCEFWTFEFAWSRLHECGNSLLYCSLFIHSLFAANFSIQIYSGCSFFYFI